MQELRFEPINVAVTNVNIRREKHGEDNVIAVDLNCRAEVPTKMLDNLLFGQHEKIEKIVYSGNDFRKVGGIGTIPFETTFENYIISLNYSHDDEKAMRFKDVKLCKFKAEIKEGGMSELAWQTQINPSDEQFLYLCSGYKYEYWDYECIGAAQGDLLAGSEKEENQEDVQEEEQTEMEQEETEEESNVVGFQYPKTEISQRPE